MHALQIEQAKAALKAALLGMLLAHSPADGGDGFLEKINVDLSIDEEGEIDAIFEISTSDRTGFIPFAGGSL